MWSERWWKNWSGSQGLLKLPTSEALSFWVLVGICVEKDKGLSRFLISDLSHFLTHPGKKALRMHFCLPIFPLNSSMKRLPSWQWGTTWPQTQVPWSCWSLADATHHGALHWCGWLLSHLSLSEGGPDGWRRILVTKPSNHGKHQQWAWWVSNGLGSEWNMMQSSTIIRFF